MVKPFCLLLGLAKDEYYIIGRIIAASLVHGGPAPHFFSRHFLEYICGKTDVSPSIQDVTDPDIQNVLQEIVSSTSLSILRDIMAKHSTVLLLAGCLHSIKDIGERESVVQDFLKWYLFSRNAACIERFKDGLSTLNVLQKIIESPSAFEPYLCFSTQSLSSELIESIFRVEFSVAGSNKRREEGRIASYWADYLLDIEGNISSTDPTLEDIVMFATGLKMIPPLGFEPRPTIKFLHDNSPFPTANTCSNTLCLPLHSSYDSFKFHISFGILNSPGFGLY
ncbi:G2/M phase-specific E3 ubiquitin-protein ligase-like [Erpetoichthys calabaricus]|uniref:G2/M phase-specific E3 ubiquitin-protein ligase-like n=2 Tax=Erpetoichthys calabaricus TaxID=27687 RepID=UPI002234A5D3|nr:G2/M phase-specific E3 ubiquitin-protein ligase-like [Erpetoichthys calabaricus]